MISSRFSTARIPTTITDSGENPFRCVLFHFPNPLDTRTNYQQIEIFEINKFEKKKKKKIEINKCWILLKTISSRQFKEIKNKKKINYPRWDKIWCIFCLASVSLTGISSHKITIFSLQCNFLIPYTGGAFAPVRPFHFPTTEEKKRACCPSALGPLRLWPEVLKLEKYKFLIVFFVNSVKCKL